MSIANKVLNELNSPNSRWLLEAVLRVGYRLKGVNVELIKYHHEFNAWEFRIDGVSYLSSGPGWAYTDSFLRGQLKKLSGNQYLPGEGDVVIDIGAGVGEETIIFSKLVGQTGKVFSIEAHPKTYKALTYLTSKNFLSNVVCLNFALSDTEGFLEIDDTDNSLANTILPISKQKGFQVQSYTFDQFVEQQQIEKIDLVKMNVEGAEQLIIMGMGNSIYKIKNIAISCHDFLYEQGGSEFFRTKAKVIQFLQDNHFTIATQKTQVNMVDDYVYASNPLFTSESK